MTEIEQKALALVNEVTFGDEPWTLDDVRGGFVFKALCRAIEQHEAFKREVSDEIAKLGCWPDTVNLQRFILPKPDPLVEVMQAWWDTDGYANIDTFRAALAKHGGKIVWGEG